MKNKDVTSAWTQARFNAINQYSMQVSVKEHGTWGHRPMLRATRAAGFYVGGVGLTPNRKTRQVPLTEEI